MTAGAPDKPAIRRAMRARRRALTGAERRRAADRLAVGAATAGGPGRGHRVAAYFPRYGEIDPQPLMQRLRALGARCYLPVLAGGCVGRLLFARFDTDAETVANRFGIPEPACRADMLAAIALDVVYVPLVAFDDRGNRIGMGGGWYDRTLAFLRSRGGYRRPRVIGLAYEFQRVAEIPPEPWDIPLDGVLTELRYHPFAAARQALQ